MRTSGDLVDIEFGTPEGREAGFRHPAVLVTAQRILDADPSVVHVVPVTTRLRGFRSEVALEPDAGNGLDEPSAAQCQHLRAVSPNRMSEVRGNVGTVALAQIRDVIAVILDLP